MDSQVSFSKELEFYTPEEICEALVSTNNVPKEVCKHETMECNTPKEVQICHVGDHIGHRVVLSGNISSIQRPKHSPMLVIITDGSLYLRCAAPESLEEVTIRHKTTSIIRGQDHTGVPVRQKTEDVNLSAEHSKRPDPGALPKDHPRIFSCKSRRIKQFCKVHSMCDTCKQETVTKATCPNNHTYCKTCVKKMIESNMKQEKLKILCPKPGCEAEIKMEELVHIEPSFTMFRYKLYISRRLVGYPTIRTKKRSQSMKSKSPTKEPVLDPRNMMLGWNGVSHNLAKEAASFRIGDEIVVSGLVRVWDEKNPGPENFEVIVEYWQLKKSPALIEVDQVTQQVLDRTFTQMLSVHNLQDQLHSYSQQLEQATNPLLDLATQAVCDGTPDVDVQAELLAQYNQLATWAIPALNVPSSSEFKTGAGDVEPTVRSFFGSLSEHLPG